MLVSLTAVALFSSAVAAEVPAQLLPFEPFLDRTWKALVDADRGVYDVARWERALAGQAFRMVHSVGEGAYGGETLVMWDRSREVLAYTYFTTAGFFTEGTMSFDGSGLLESRELVTGNQDGVTEVESVQEL